MLLCMEQKYLDRTLYVKYTSSNKFYDNSKIIFTRSLFNKFIAYGNINSPYVLEEANLLEKHNIEEPSHGVLPNFSNVKLKKIID